MSKTFGVTENFARLSWARWRALLVLATYIVAPSREGFAASNIWTPIGPNGGRVSTIVVQATDPAVAFAGTQRAGVFTTTDSGRHWSPTGGLVGLIVSELILDQQNPETLYARAEHYPEGIGLYKSVDRGRTWTSITIAGGTRGETRTIVIDPLVPTTLYAGLANAGVYRSMDGGKTWSVLSSSPMGVYVKRLAIDPSDPEILYAGTFRGVFGTTDAGETWQPMNDGLPGRPDVNTIVVDPFDPSTVYVGAQEGFFASDDAGEHWVPADAGLRQPSLVKAVAFDPRSPDTPYVIAAGDCPGYICVGAVYKRTEGGQGWSALPVTDRFDFVNALAVAPDGTMFAGGTYGGIFKSTDSGETWNNSSDGLTASRVHSLISVPTVPSTTYAGVFGGAFKSVGGAAWRGSGIGIAEPTVYRLFSAPDDVETVYAISGGDVLISEDGGDHWTDTGLPMGATSLAIDPTSAATLYAGTYESGVYKSVDRGSQWLPINDGLTDERIPSECGLPRVTALAVAPAVPATVYAAVEFCDAVVQFPYPFLFKSDDGGTSWTELPANFSDLDTLLIDPTVPDTLYAISRQGISKSIDGGVHWRGINDGLQGYPSALAMDPTTSATLYAGTYDGVFKSTDAGEQWQPLNKGFAPRTGPYPRVTALAVDALDPSTVFAGTGEAQAGGYGVFVLHQRSICVGDCDEDDQVTVDEVITAVEIALGKSGVGVCANVDSDDDGFVTVDDVVIAINHLLDGCSETRRFRTETAVNE